MLPPLPIEHFPSLGKARPDFFQALEKSTQNFPSLGGLRRTSNTEHPTSNIERPILTSMFGVRCSMFDVLRGLA
jgi:hypothetical protein